VEGVEVWKGGRRGMLYEFSIQLHNVYTHAPLPSGSAGTETKHTVHPQAGETGNNCHMTQ